VSASQEIKRSTTYTAERKYIAEMSLQTKKKVKERKLIAMWRVLWFLRRTRKDNNNSEGLLTVILGG